MENNKKDGELMIDMCLNKNYFVVQHNNLITGKQSLSVNAAKILRAAIMQVVRDDEELKPYVMTSKEVAELLHIARDNIYRVMNDVSDELMNSRVEVRVESLNNNKKKYKKINWVSFCEYDSDVGFAIKLNNDMQPYVLKLKHNYTQYSIDNILAMKSVYGIRIFELLQEEMKNGNKPLPRKGIHIKLPVQFIRECCNCEEKYTRFSQFKARVIDRAVEEINRVTAYEVTYEYIKERKTITAINFHVNVKYH